MQGVRHRMALAPHDEARFTGPSQNVTDGAARVDATDPRGQRIRSEQAGVNGWSTRASGHSPTRQAQDGRGPVRTASRVSPTSSVSLASHPQPASSAGSGGSTSPDFQRNCPRGSAFILSLVSGYHGWSSPVQAARQFSRQPDPAGYGHVEHRLDSQRCRPAGSDPHCDRLVLHAVRLPNGRWAIDSGERGA